MQAKSKSDLLGKIDEKKELYLLLAEPLIDKGSVARRYCSECGQLFELPAAEFTAFVESMGGEQKLNPKTFFPDYYFETEGCGACRSVDNPPQNFFVRRRALLTLKARESQN